MVGLVLLCRGERMDWYGLGEQTKGLLRRESGRLWAKGVGGLGYGVWLFGGCGKGGGEDVR